MNCRIYDFYFYLCFVFAARFSNACVQSENNKNSNNTMLLQLQVSGYAQLIVVNCGINFNAFVTYIIRSPHQKVSIAAIGTMDFPHPRSTPAAQ